MKIYNQYGAPMFDTPVGVDDHLPPLTFTNQDQIEDGQSYNDFGHVILSDQKTLSPGEAIKEKMIQAKVAQATNLGLTGQAFSDFVENDIQTTVTDRADGAVDALAELQPDEQHLAVHQPTSATKLVDVMKDHHNSNGQLMEALVNSMNLQTTQLAKQNELLKQQNEIAIEKNRIAQSEADTKNALFKVTTDAMTSVAQSLGYLPHLIETLAVASDRQVEIGNIKNAHALQKNVNDAYEFKYDKTAPDGLRKTQKSIAEDHQKVGVHAQHEVNIIDEENAAIDIFHNAVDYFFDDTNIFKALLETGRMDS